MILCIICSLSITTASSQSSFKTPTCEEARCSHTHFIGHFSTCDTSFSLKCHLHYCSRRGSRTQRCSFRRYITNMSYLHLVFVIERSPEYVRLCLPFPPLLVIHGDRMIEAGGAVGFKRHDGNYSESFRSICSVFSGDNKVKADHHPRPLVCSQL